MKTKKLNKKLRFKKETVVDLNTNAMEAAYGGGPDPRSFLITGCTCETYCTCTCGSWPGACCNTD